MQTPRDPRDTDPSELIDDTEIELARDFDLETEAERRRVGRDTQRFSPGSDNPPVGAIRLPTDSDEALPHPQVGGRYLNYVIRRRIARGSMGLIYEATHLHLARSVAIKFLHPSLLTDECAVLRFLGEARAMARIVHRGIPVIHDFGQDTAGNAYLIMERLRGETLGQRLEAGPVDLRLALELGAQIADALAAAHRAGVIHRDLRPDNVFLVEGAALQIKLVDFGAARAGSSDRAGYQTASGCLVGTPAYMAPEQTYSGQLAPATDIYALGCLLHELVAGQPPFAGSVAELVHAHRHERAPALGAHIPRPLVRLIESMLDKRLEQRPANGSEVARRLREIAERCQLGWVDPMAATAQLCLDDVEAALAASIRSGRPLAEGTVAPDDSCPRLEPVRPIPLGLAPESTPIPFYPQIDGTPRPFPMTPFPPPRRTRTPAMFRPLWLWVALATLALAAATWLAL